MQWDPQVIYHISSNSLSPPKSTRVKGKEEKAVLDTIALN